MADRYQTLMGVEPKPVEDHSDKPCRACAYSYMEPDEPLLICGVKSIPGATGFGLYLNPRLEGGGRGPETPICGADRPKFEQHPLRGPDGSLGRAT